MDKLTNAEAISAIKNNMPIKGTYIILTEALDLAIEALEKQQPQKPDGWNSDCYGCGYHLDTPLDRPNYCPNCGQKIDWSEEDD